MLEKLVSVSRAASRAATATGSVGRHLRRRKATRLIGKQVFKIGTWSPLARLASVEIDRAAAHISSR